MRATKTEVSKKYKTIRLPADSLYSSRLIQTFLNKFTRRGKKSTSRNHLFTALSAYRRSMRRPQLFFALIRLFFRLRVQFILVQRRQARKMLNIPSPLRRNKRDTLSLQTLYKAVCGRRERTLSERVQYELLSLHQDARHSATLRSQNDYVVSIYKERANMERRWK